MVGLVALQKWPSIHSSQIEEEEKRGNYGFQNIWIYCPISYHISDMIDILYIYWETKRWIRYVQCTLFLKIDRDISYFLVEYDMRIIISILSNVEQVSERWLWFENDPFSIPHKYPMIYESHRLQSQAGRVPLLLLSSKETDIKIFWKPVIGILFELHYRSDHQRNMKPNKTTEYPIYSLLGIHIMCIWPTM